MSFVDGVVEKATTEFKPRFFTTDEITSATANFSKKLGQGGFGSVFHGKLEDGSEIAVKVLSDFSNQGEEEFLNEIQLLSCANHKHLVSLLGYNSQPQELMLIYEYMPGGSLKDRIYGPASEGKELTWKERVLIALDAALGLQYLHDECKKRFIHRDIKTANILLDRNLRGKLSDFGLSKGTMNDEASHITTLVKGTFGYLDPEYFETQMLTEKSDIYSFGVVLFEIIFGRQAVNSRLPQEEVNLVRWAKPYLKTKQERVLLKVMDKKLMGRFSNINSIMRAAKTAMVCVQQDPSRRPRISELVMQLKRVVQEEDNTITQPKYSYIRAFSGNRVLDMIKHKESLPKRTNESNQERFANKEFNNQRLANEESNFQKFTLKEIIRATKNFSKTWAVGELETIYKGNLKNGEPVAVRVFLDLFPPRNQDFVNEVEHISHVRHRHLVNLLGYSFNKFSNPILVCEYLPGRLRHCLHGVSESKALKWRERLQIALDVAQALKYLHEECNPKQIHKSVNTSNILLGSNLRAKLSNFGFSEWTEDSKASQIASGMKSTLGYVDPKYAIDDVLDDKSDIYSFGIVLLEMICGKEPYMLDVREIQSNLVKWVSQSFEAKANPLAFMRFIDDQLRNSFFFIDSLVHVAKLALSCVDMDKSIRPSASQLVLQLKDALQEEDMAIDAYFVEPISSKTMGIRRHSFDV